MPHSLTTPPRTVNIAEYLFTRLRQLGCLSCHGLPGDFSLRMLDFVHSSGVQWVGNCNELNAGYAADAYARLNGLGALCTTFGVGELSAVNAVAGSYAERVPVVHIVGTPGRKSQREGMLLHHTVSFLFFFKLDCEKDILLLSTTDDDLMISIYLARKRRFPRLRPHSSRNHNCANQSPRSDYCSCRNRSCARYLLQRFSTRVYSITDGYGRSGCRCEFVGNPD